MAQNFHVSVPQHRGSPLKAAIEKIKAAALDPDNDSEIAELVRTGMERANDPERQQLIDKLKRNNKSAFAKLGVDEVELAMLSTSTLRKLSARLAAHKTSLPSPGKAPSRQSAGDMRPAAGTTRLIPRPAPYASARDPELMQASVRARVFGRKPRVDNPRLSEETMPPERRAHKNQQIAATHLVDEVTKIGGSDGLRTRNGIDLINFVGPHAQDVLLHPITKGELVV